MWTQELQHCSTTRLAPALAGPDSERCQPVVALEKGRSCSRGLPCTAPMHCPYALQQQLHPGTGGSAAWGGSAEEPGPGGAKQPACIHSWHAGMGASWWVPCAGSVRGSDSGCRVPACTPGKSPPLALQHLPCMFPHLGPPPLHGRWRTLPPNPCHIPQEMHLHGNELGDEGAQALCNRLMKRTQGAPQGDVSSLYRSHRVPGSHRGPAPWDLHCTARQLQLGKLCWLVTECPGVSSCQHGSPSPH